MVKPDIIEGANWLYPSVCRYKWAHQHVADYFKFIIYIFWNNRLLQQCCDVFNYIHA